MAYPYYVSPEQMMQDKAEYAKKGISRGRSIMVMEYVDGPSLAEVLSKELAEGRFNMTVRVDETKRDIVVDRFDAVPHPP